MLRVSLGNYGFGNREQALHQGVERLKFLRRTGHVASMIAPVCLVALLSFSCTQQLEASEGQKQSSTNDQKISTPPINITITTPEKSAKEKQEESERAARQESRDASIVAANKRIAFWTVVIGIVGGIQMIATFLGFSAAIRSANAATKSAETAVLAVNHAKENARIDQRAWIGLSSYGLRELQPGGNVVYFELHIRNTGRTPGLNVTTSVVVILADRQPIPDWTTAATDTPSVIFPNAEPQLPTIHFAMNQEDTDSYRTRKKKIYIFSRTTYQDWVGDEHWTTVSAYHSFNGPFTFCDSGNDVDRPFGTVSDFRTNASKA